MGFLEAILWVIVVCLLGYTVFKLFVTGNVSYGPLHIIWGNFTK